MGVVVWSGGESGRGVGGREKVWNCNGKFGAKKEGEISQACPRGWGNISLVHTSEGQTYMMNDHLETTQTHHSEVTNLSSCKSSTKQEGPHSRRLCILQEHIARNWPHPDRKRPADEA